MVRFCLSAAILAVVCFAGAGCGIVGPKTHSTCLKNSHAGGEPAGVLEKRAKAHAHYAAGILHELNEEIDLALEQFYKAAMGDLENETLVVNVSRRLQEHQQPQKALQLLTNATARADASGALYAQLGSVYAQLGMTNLAIQANRIAIKKDPSSLAGYRNLFVHYCQDKRFDEALRVLEEAGKQQELSVEFLLNLAELFGGLARLSPENKTAANAQALESLERAAALKPTDPVLQLRLADGLNALGETTKAAHLYLEVLKQLNAGNELPLPGNIVRAKLAELYLRAQDRARAIEQLEGIVREDPTNPFGYYYLATIAFEEKRMTNAVENFSKVLLLNPDFEQAYYDLASAQINLDRPQDALATLEKARARFAQNFVIPFLMGLAYSRTRDYPKAIACFTEAEVFAQVRDPSRLKPFFYFQTGAAYERMGELAQAEKYLEKAIELDPDYADALNYLGYMWADQGRNLERARVLIERAVKLDPKNGAFLDSLGWVLFKLNQPQAALEQLLKAVEFSEEPDATIYDHLGDVYSALGQTEKAREAWRKSVAIQPSEAVQRKLGEPMDK